MKRICLLGVLGLLLLLGGCKFRPFGPLDEDSPVYKAKINAQEETRLIYTIRAAQAEYEKYLKDRLADCQLQSEVLVRDQDGILVCVVPPKKTEENK